MRVGESVWYCKKLATADSNGNLYAPPVEIKTRFMYFTVMTKNGYLDIQELGKNVSHNLTAIAQPYNAWKNTFTEDGGDLFYCNGNQPSQDEEWYGQNANFVVDSVDFGNARIKLNLKRTAK